MSYYDHHKRSLAKSIGYIFLVVIADWVVTLTITQKISESITITFYTNLVGLIIYFIHERAWNYIHWGRTKIEIDLVEHQKKS